MDSTTNNKIMLWNCRGAANKAFRRISRNYIWGVLSDIVVILETNMDPKKLNKAVKFMGFDNIVGV